MKNIKFRQWNPYKKVMCSWEEYSISMCNGLANDSLMSSLMLFTGLKDKNGKEIYEGDIIKITRVNWYCPGHPQNNTDLIDQVEVYWDEEKNGMFTRTFDFERLKRNPNQRQYSSSSTLGDGWNDERADKNIWEVIGNIYENPELLKRYAKCVEDVSC